MHESIYIAASAGIKQGRKLDVVANNLANLTNSGFKRDGLVFREMIPPFEPDLNFDSSRNILLPPESSNASASYVGINDFYTDFSQGPFVRTGNELDLALEGDGFFVVRAQQGERYARNGNFRLDSENRLVTQEGNPVLGPNGLPILIRETGGKINIDPSGNISVGRGLENVLIGRLQITSFKNTNSLMKEGEGLFRMDDPNMPKETSVSAVVRQGFLEGSNTSAMEELLQMVGSLRAMETYQKIIQTIDTMDDRSVNEIARVA